MTKGTPTKRRPGRPEFAPTAAQRRRVSIAAGGGMRHDDIAAALGISAPTLRKHFEIELSTGAGMRRMEVLEALHRAARKGSTSAAKAFLAAEPQGGLVPPAPGEGATPQPAAAAKPAQPLGKKEQAQVDARTAAVGTEWDTLLKPQAPLQ